MANQYFQPIENMWMMEPLFLKWGHIWGKYGGRVHILDSFKKNVLSLTSSSQLDRLTWGSISACLSLFLLLPNMPHNLLIWSTSTLFLIETDPCTNPPNILNLWFNQTERQTGWQNAEQQPAKWLRAGGRIAGGGESGVECGEREHLGIPLPQSHPSSLFLWDWRAKPQAWGEDIKGLTMRAEEIDLFKTAVAKQWCSARFVAFSFTSVFLFYLLITYGWPVGKHSQ